MAVKRIEPIQRFIGLKNDTKPTEGINNGSVFYEYEVDPISFGCNYIGEYKFFDGYWCQNSSTISDSGGNIIDFPTYQQTQNDVAQSLYSIVLELKKINIHLSLINGAEIKDKDIQGE